MRTVSLAILVFAATSACNDASAPSSGAIAENTREPAAPPSVTTPRAPAEERVRVEPEPLAAPRDDPSPAPTDALDDRARVEPEPLAAPRDDPSPAPTDALDDLAVAWYDASLADNTLTLLCDSTASWVRHDLDARTSCVPDGQTVYVLEAHGVEPWTVRARKRGDHHLSPELVRPGAQQPTTSMLTLVMRTPPRAANARLQPLRARRPSARTRAAARAVATTAAAVDGEHDVDELQLRAVAEVRGAFGGDADTIAVFEVDDAAPDLAGYQVLAALARGKVVGTFGASPLQWSGYEVIGVTDLDGDGHQELLWWARAEGVGIGVNLTRFSDGVYRLHNLFACECGGAFKSAYPRR